MGNTSRYGWAYPEVGDPPNTALHIKDALDDVEATVGALDDALAALDDAKGKLIRASSDLPITPNTWTRITFDTVADPVVGLANTGNHTLTILTPGRYALAMAARTSTSAYMEVAIAASGTGTGTPVAPYAFNGTNNNPQCGCATVEDLAAGATISAHVYCSVGSIVAGTNFDAYLTVRRVA